MKKENYSHCKCPFCETELKMACFEPSFCQVCQVKFILCKKCGQMFNEKLKKCPHCAGKKGGAR